MDGLGQLHDEQGCPGRPGDYFFPWGCRVDPLCPVLASFQNRWEFGETTAPRVTSGAGASVLPRADPHGGSSDWLRISMGGFTGGRGAAAGAVAARWGSP